jgi:hypothetical protein
VANYGDVRKSGKIFSEKARLVLTVCGSRLVEMKQVRGPPGQQEGHGETAEKALVVIVSPYFSSSKASSSYPATIRSGLFQQFHGGHVTFRAQVVLLSGVVALKK